MSKLTTAEAIAMAKSKWWEGMSAHDIVSFQLYEEKLCMDFGAFHKATEEALGRGVWSHEFGWPDRLREEFEGKAKPATFAEVLALIPKEKRVVVVVVDAVGD